MSKRKRSSAILAEETSFPRSGENDNTLTPIEYKQISNQAARDVLAEQNKNKSKPKRKYTKKAEKDGLFASAKKDAVPYISLKDVKRLSGSLSFFGQVSAINETEITVSLPGSLTAVYPISSDDEDSDSNSDEEDDDDEKNLAKNSFYQGQYLKVFVSSTINNKIELSIQDSDDTEEEEICENNTIPVKVLSKEDYGFIVKIGSKNRKGFLSNKNLVRDPSEYRPGQYLLTTIVKIGSQNQDIILAEKPDFTTAIDIDSLENYNLLKPGFLLKTTVKKIHKNGIFFDSGKSDASLYSNLYQLPQNSTDDYEIGQEVTARIISVSTDSSNKESIYLSLLPHYVNLDLSNVQQELISNDYVSAHKGSAKITHNAIDSHVGLFSHIYNDSATFNAFAHFTKIRDDSESLVLQADNYEVGSKHEFKILRYSLADGLYLISLQPSVINTRYLNFSDVKVGDLFDDATVDSYTSNGAMLVNLVKDGQIKGLVPSLHISDIKLSNPEKKFKIGSKVKGIVSTYKRGLW